MGKTIRVDESGVQSDQSMLAQGLEEYCGCELRHIGVVVPTSGSARHDSELAGVLQKSLEAYKSLVLGDVRLYGSSADALRNVDWRLGGAFMRE